MKSAQLAVLFCAWSFYAPTCFGADVNAIGDDLSVRLGDLGLSLSKGLSGQNSGKGASFSYTNEKGTPDQFAVQFALAYNTNVFSNRILSDGEIRTTFDASVEGNVVTHDKKTTSFINFRPQLGLFVVPDRVHVFDVPTAYIRIGPLYEVSKDFNLQNALFEVELAPTYGPLAVSVAKTILPGIAFQWQPLLTFQAGKNTIARTKTNEDGTSRLRFVPDVGGTLYFQGLAHALDVPGISLSAEDQLAYLPNQNRHKNSFNYFTSSLDIDLIKDRVSVEFSFDNGSQAPFFENDRTYKISLTIKLGTRSGPPLGYPNPS